MKKSNALLIVFCFTLASMLSCQPFNYKKKIADKYYLIGVDSKNYLTISRKLGNGDYIGRVPAKVLEYGIRDSFIVAKSQQKGAISYYIVNMQRDSEYAHEEEYLIGPLTINEFNEQWQTRVNVALKKP